MFVCDFVVWAEIINTVAQSSRPKAPQPTVTNHSDYHAVVLLDKGRPVLAMNGTAPEQSTVAAFRESRPAARRGGCEPLRPQRVTAKLWFISG